ncbi:MAG: thioredoxin family protein [Pseudomonadota bacterium]
MSLERPPICEFGKPAPHFMLPDTDGQIYSLDECRGPKGTVVMFICNHCPYVVAIADRLAAEADALRDIGVSTVAICSNDAVAYPEDAPDRMGAFARRYGFPFPYLHDESQKAARAYGAVCTPDFFGYDAGLGLQYRGRLDATTPGRAGDGRRELFEAMSAVAETGHGPEAQTPSMGCSIKWKAA